MKFLRIFRCLAPAALMLAFSSLSSASIVPNGSFGFALYGCCTLDGGTGTDLLTANSISWDPSEGFTITTKDGTTFNKPNVFQGLFKTEGVLLPDTLTVPPPTPPTLSAEFGPKDINGDYFYSFVATSASIAINNAQRSISLYFLGNFADSSDTYTSGGPASLTLTFSQSAPGASIAASGTFSIPPATNTLTPEPASMALMGSALIAVGLIGRKKLVRR